MSTYFTFLCGEGLESVHLSVHSMNMMFHRSQYSSGHPLRALFPASCGRSEARTLGDKWGWNLQNAFSALQALKPDLDPSELDRSFVAYVGAECASIDLVPSVGEKDELTVLAMEITIPFLQIDSSLYGFHKATSGSGLVVT